MMTSVHIDPDAQKKLNFLFDVLYDCNLDYSWIKTIQQSICWM